MPQVEDALALAARGFLVIPIHVAIGPDRCSCLDARCGANIGKHPRYDWKLLRDGLKSATLDPDLIYAWWSMWPGSNVAIITGRKPDGSGVVAGDVDPRHGGDLSWREIEAQDGGYPPTLTSLTGGGGTHYLWDPGDLELASMIGLVAPGVDFKGEGSYILAPPSGHKSGNQYVWDVGQPDVPAPIPPAFLARLEAARKHRTVHASVNVNGLGEIQYTIEAGARNVTLLSEAGVLRRAGHEFDVINAALQAHNAEATDDPLDEAEVSKIARSVSKYPAAFGPDNARRDESGQPVLDDAAILKTLTDLGNADRIASRYGHVLRYTSGLGWLAWDGKRWQRNEKRALGVAIQAIRDLTLETVLSTEKTVIEAIEKHAMRSRNGGHIKQALDYASGLEPIMDDDAAWDADPWLLNVANGTIDLRMGTLGPHDPANRITKLSPVTFDPAATCPTWLRFLGEIFFGDAELIEFHRQAIGYTLTGVIAEHIFFIAYGIGRNGKSRVFDTIAGLLGEYAAEVPAGILEMDRSEKHATDLMTLRGIRFAAANETNEGRRLDEARVKMLTGGDLIPGRYMRQDYTHFEPTHKLWLRTNHRPVIRGTDRAIWERIALVPYRLNLEKAEQDTKLQAKLNAELPGILNWAIGGSLTWQQSGLTSPPAVTDATSGYRSDMDTIQQWLDDACEVARPLRSTNQQLLASYQAWAEGQGESRKTSSQWLGRKLADRGFEQWRNGTARGWDGIAPKTLGG